MRPCHFSFWAEAPTGEHIRCGVTITLAKEGRWDAHFGAQVQPPALEGKRQTSAGLFLGGQVHSAQDSFVKVWRNLIGRDGFPLQVPTLSAEAGEEDGRCENGGNHSMVY